MNLSYFTHENILGPERDQCDGPVRTKQGQKIEESGPKQDQTRTPK